MARKIWQQASVDPTASPSGRAWEVRTNRLRCSQLLEEFRNAGFVVAELEAMKWPTPPTERRKLAEPFRSMPEDDLLVFELDVLLRPS